MAKGQSSASATWNGTLRDGSGRVQLGSGAAAELPVSWPSRVAGAEGGHTTPEELIAAAHAACYSMALSNILGGKGTPPRQLDVSARVTFEVGAGGARISKILLTVVGDVPGADDAAFHGAAGDAKAGCPVSKALAGNVDIELEASLKR
jgi:osmotically inducible protein OsmC